MGFIVFAVPSSAFGLQTNAALFRREQSLRLEDRHGLCKRNTGTQKAEDIGDPVKDLATQRHITAFQRYAFAGSYYKYSQRTVTFSLPWQQLSLVHSFV